MIDLRAQLQTTLGAAFTLERELGGGGMSRVFVATEHALGRTVVVKVLAPELAQGLSAERFTREIKLAAALQEPHIVPVLTAGESGGLPWFSMPYVEGEALRERMHAGRLPTGDALRILRDVALALEYAHARGVVHRDIKPENILLSGRTAVVADFGIAKAVSAARAQPAEAPTLTSVGQAIGTPAYMAPEQVAGDAVDHRVDLYAWGMVAYELLAGRHPFADKPGVQQLLTAQLVETPAPLETVAPGLAPPLAALVTACLAKEASARPQSAGELLAALEGIATPSTGSRTGARAAGTTTGAPVRRTAFARPALALGAVLAIGGAGAWVVRGTSATGDARAVAGVADATRDAALTIAVLPFEHRGDSGTAYFTSGMSDALRGKLTGLPELSVTARSSSVEYARSDKRADEIARELGVRYLLTGTVSVVRTAQGERVQVNPELVEVAPGGRPVSKWQAPFEGDLSDVFRVQGEIATRVAEAMQVALGGGERATLASAPTRDREAYDLYLRGAALYQSGVGHDPVRQRQVVRYFEDAVARDSLFLDAWSLLAVAYTTQADGAVKTEAIRRRAQAAVDRALRIDSTAPAAVRARLAYTATFDPNPRRDLSVVEAALRRHPRDPQLLGARAGTLASLHRHEESLRDRVLTLELDPRNPIRHRGMAGTLQSLGRYAEAVAASRRAVELAPRGMSGHNQLVYALVALGDLAGARAAIESAITALGRDPALVNIAVYGDGSWLLTPAQQEHLLSLGADAFDGDVATQAVVRAQLHRLRGDTLAMRRWGRIAAEALARQLSEAGVGDAQTRMIRAQMLAMAGDGARAITEGEAALREPDAQVPEARNYLLLLHAQILMHAGRSDAAVAQLEEALRVSRTTSPAWLALEPTWKPLATNPRFQRLVAPR